MNTQRYTVNVRVGGIGSPRVAVSQGDIGRRLVFNLFDGAVAFAVTSGTTVTIVGRKPSGLGFDEECTLDGGNSVSVLTTEAMTQEAGKIPAELRISDGTKVIGTANFVFYVEPSSHPDGTTDGTLETMDDIQTQIGDLSDLTTSDKSSLVGAINEAAQSGGSEITVDDTLTIVGAAADAKKTGDEIGAIKADLGDLSDLETTDKSSIVAAINEAAQSGGGGGGSSTLAGLTDTSISNKVDGQVLTYNGTSNKWVNCAPSGGSVEIEVDNELSNTSENPVQNKVINTALEAHGLRLTALEAESGGGDGTGGLPAAFSLAMYNMLSHLTGTFDDEHGQDYINAVITAMGYDGGGDEGGDDEARIPSDYQEVEYIESTGYSYFKIDKPAGALPVKIETGLHKTTQATSEQCVIMARQGDTTCWEIGFNSTANTIFAFSSQSAKVSNEAVYGNKIDVVAQFNATSPYKQLSVTANETTLTAESTNANAASAGSTSAILNFFAGIGNTAGNRAAFRMYYCKIYDASNNLVVDLVPCYRKSDDVTGMYDLVDEAFYRSMSNTNFLKGDNV